MSWAIQNDRTNRLTAIAAFIVFALFAKVLLMIVLEYRSYFPADFDSRFLTGRGHYFHGMYAQAFYVHIVSGPVALVLGFTLMFSGLRTRFLKAHRLLGKIQMLLVVGAVAPSGLVMATRAYTGQVAGWGFACLAVCTAATAIAAVHFAIQRNIERHQKYATRCFILLCSPLLLRLISGAVIVLQVESHLTYRLSAWLSWLVPLVMYEIWCRRNK